MILSIVGIQKVLYGNRVIHLAICKDFIDESVISEIVFASLVDTKDAASVRRGDLSVIEVSMGSSDRRIGQLKSPASY